MEAARLDEVLAFIVLGILSVALGIVFLLVHDRSKATVGLCLCWVNAGLFMVTGPLFAQKVDPGGANLLERLVIFDAAVIASSGVYVAGLIETAAEASPRARAMMPVVVRFSYAWAAVIAVLGAVFPAERFNDFGWGLGQPGWASRPGFWLFTAAWTVVLLVFCAAWAVLSRQQIDGGENARATCNAWAVVFLTLSLVLPLAVSIFSVLAACVVMLYGEFRFFAAQGERGVFLSRFLSPQVSELVRVKGLATVMQPREVDLTVVCCDLRGFTSYAEAVPSQAVIDLLEEYYDAIGRAVAEVDGTIKDFAGDGVLVLVGAPLERPDHARAGLLLATRMLEAGRQVTRRWATGPHPLGVGVGVASGRVTVGAIGSSGRTEYTAVGTPVNLSARLCSSARDGEILVDARTAELAGAEQLEERRPIQLKGLSNPSAVFAVPATALER